MKQNPFSFYDFLGYILPGALLLYILTFVFGMDNFVSVLSLNESSSSSVSHLLSFIPAVIFSYLLGHVLAIGSSAVIESFTNYANGYPSKFLFVVEVESYLSSEKKRDNFGRIILWFLILPISIFKLILKDLLKIKMFNQAKCLPEQLRNAVFFKCKRILDEVVGVETSELKIEKGIDGDYLRLLYHFVFENSERHAGKLQNYVALYGLTRNVSFVFILSFWLSVYSLLTKSQEISLWHVISFGMLSYIFYIGFVKFYRRYTLEVIMAVSVYRIKDS